MMEQAKDAKKPVTSVAHVDTGKNMTSNATIAQNEAINHFKEAEEEAQHHKEKAEVMH